MPAKSPRSGYQLTSEESSRGGKKSKRPKTLNNRLDEILSGEIHKKVLEDLRDRRILVDGKLVSHPAKVLDKHAGDAIVLAILSEALAREPWALQLLAKYRLTEQAKQFELSGQDGQPLIPAKLTVEWGDGK